MPYIIAEIGINHEGKIKRAMKLIKNAKKALDAGCNLVLHCNANYKEMLIVAKNSPLLSDFIIKKTSQLMNIIR